jgi:hypothetical protein
MRPASVAIVGAAETEEIWQAPDTPEIELHAEAALRAVADAGVTLADIDERDAPAARARHLPRFEATVDR